MWAKRKLSDLADKTQKFCLPAIVYINDFLHFLFYADKVQNWDHVKSCKAYCYAFLSAFSVRKNQTFLNCRVESAKTVRPTMSIIQSVAHCGRYSKLLYFL